MNRITILFALLVNITLAQKIVLHGYVFDSATLSPLPDANVIIEGTDLGTTSNNSGYYEISNLETIEYKIKVSFVGYETQIRLLKITADTELNFFLNPSPILLDETIVEVTQVKQRETPISFSQLKADKIESRLGARDAMQILNTLPNVYVSPQGGGLGDLRLNIRGFDQTNIGVMLNGVPINNPENGEVYWSNYAGIADVISNVQVQGGLGASPYSTSSVGGLVNIITTGFPNEKTNSVFKLESGSDNFRKATLAISKPIVNSVSITALVSRKLWDGYADKTNLEEFTYYLSAGFTTANHSLILQLIGSPQNHDQRITPSLISDYEKYGINYNPDWGYLNGHPLSLRDNKFHKPSLDLIHNWKLNSDWNISTVLYYTYGEGGGTVPPYASFDKTDNGLINFQKEWDFNSTNIDTTYHQTLTRSVNPLRDVVHKHNWFGGITSLNYKTNSANFSVGVDGKYYEAQNYAEVGNLLGGDYYIGFANKNRDPNTLLKPGDKIDYDADSFAKQFGGFTQAEFFIGKLNTLLNVAVSNTSYKRRDNFNYSPDDPMFETDWESFFNYSLKAGLNYKLDTRNNAYVNVSYFTKAPIAFNVFDYSNNKYQNVVNEKIFNSELGYGLAGSNFQLNVNAYYTTWKDQAISRTIQDQNTGRYFFYNISGASARHLGLESNFNLRLSNNLIFDGMFSYAVNKWTSDVNTVLAPESNPTQTEQISSYVNDLYVGNSPMTRAYLAGTYSFYFGHAHTLSFTPSFTFFGRIYADYDPANRNNIIEQGINAWRMPDYYLIDFHVNYTWELDSEFFNRVSAAFHIFNLTNNDNIVYALDGQTHDGNSARVFYGRERNWSLSFTFNF